MATEVLVVEDELMLRTGIAAVLQGAGYEVETAPDGLQALARLEQMPRCAAMLLDLRMPVLDGHGVLARLRDDPRHQHLPVIVMTALSDGRPPDAAAFLRKPLDPTVLLATVALCTRGVRRAA